MATIDDARDAVYLRFITEAAEHDAFDGISLARLSASPPGRLSLGAEEGPSPEDTAIWLRLVLRHTGRVQDTMGPVGGRRFRNDASIFAVCFVPLREPGGPAPRGDQIIEAFKAIFSSRHIMTPAGERITTYASVPLEQAPDGPWLPITVQTPMSYDERL